MFLLISLSISLSFMFMFMNHPLSFGLILLLQTIIMALISGLMHLNFWFSYIILLIMIGGMLILFIYMTNIASNEKFKFSSKILFSSMSIFIILSLSLLLANFYFLNLSQFNYDTLSQNLFPHFNFSLFKYINFPNNNIFYTLIIYLLISLIMVVKITNIKSGPLRQK